MEDTIIRWITYKGRRLPITKDGKVLKINKKEKENIENLDKQECDLCGRKGIFSILSGKKLCIDCYNHIVSRSGISKTERILDSDDFTLAYHNWSEEKKEITNKYKKNYPKLDVKVKRVRSITPGLGTYVVYGKYSDEVADLVDKYKNK